MKIRCPFCQKELCRINRLKYHIENSVCWSNDEERKEVIMLLNMNVSSTIDHVLQLRRKINDVLILKDEKIRLADENSKLKDEISILKRSNDALTNMSRQIDKCSKNNTTHNDDHSTHIDHIDHLTNNANTNITINNSNTIQLNLFGHENVDYIHVPNYLTDIFDIVKLVKDVHFNKDHPENHNVGIDEKHATIYKKLFLKNKILWKKYSRIEALSELIQNSETIISNYEKPLTLTEEDVRNTIIEIVEKETNWNCLTEKLLEFLEEQKQKLLMDFPPKPDQVKK